MKGMEKYVAQSVLFDFNYKQVLRKVKIIFGLIYEFVRISFPQHESFPMNYVNFLFSDYGSWSSSNMG